ncbi:MAG: NADPH-dependent glutamate synthase [Clostridia bacterium]|nr:NADPH-dependent glutamate synthase [Clostridia bacterium]
MINKKTPMPSLSAEERIKSFDEVALGYTEEMAKCEADRCIECKNKPCVSACPVNVRIPEFISSIKKGDYKTAYEIIKSTNSLPAVCGRVCPQEKQCESRCTRGIKGEPVGIGRLERFAADWYLKNIKEKEERVAEPNGHKVAVIGSGPAGLSCAGDLAALGYEVTVFEALHAAGGVLMYGIPEFRLPKSIVQSEIEQLKKKGVRFMLDMVIGKVLTVDELFENGYEAVFVGSGAGLPNFMNIPGESAAGVYSANEFLTRINLMKAYRDDYDTPIKKYKKIAVVGGGNVAMDAARCAKRLGAEEVYLIYRRSEEEMPARNEEIEHAKEEQIIFKTLTNPVRINSGESGVESVTCVRMELGEPDEGGRRSPVAVEGSEFDISVDCVVIAIGNSPNPLIRTTTEGIEVNRKGCLVVNEDLMTTRDGIFAGGDAVSGAATVILAMGAGKSAAESIDKYIKSKQ